VWAARQILRAGGRRKITKHGIAATTPVSRDTVQFIWLYLLVLVVHICFFFLWKTNNSEFILPSLAPLFVAGEIRVWWRCLAGVNSNFNHIFSNRRSIFSRKYPPPMFSGLVAIENRRKNFLQASRKSKN